MSRSRPAPAVRAPVVAAVVVLVLGALVAVGVGQALGLSFEPADTPAAVDPSTSLESTPAAGAPAISTIEIPDDDRVALAASAVSDALVDRGQPAPTTSATPTDGGADLAVRIVPSFADSPEAYRLRQDAGSRYTIEAAAPSGAAVGLYQVADRIRSGAALDATGATQQPRLGLRLTDSGSVGREADPDAFAAGTDYSLNTDVVASAVLPEAPWVDQAVVDDIDAQFKQLVQHDLREGYNGIVVPGFLEYVTFSGVGDGHQVYPEGDPHVARAEAMVAAFGPVFQYAADMGMHVYLLTDMLAVSPPLEAYLQRTVGGLSVDDPALWSVYQAGLAELFDSMPFVDGLMVRIGEGGSVYQAGWDYSSKLAVTSESSVQAMLKALLATAGEHDRDIIFRTWTVGVGAVGDLHTNPASYETVLGAIDDPHLIVSTKYTMGDFYSHLPLNPTMSVGNQRRIVEFQARREFEGFGALPNDLVPEEAQALQAFLAANPHVEGVWNWTQDGGPLRAGPMTLYLRTGFWQMYDLNTYGTARLAWDPSADPAQVTTDWVRQTLSADPATAAAITASLGRSREAITAGLYIRPYAEQSVKALGLEPPPMMWIFEWDIVTGDSAALDSIYAVSRHDLDSAVADGARATQVAAEMRAQVAGTDPQAWRSPELYHHVVDALDYETDLLGTLGAYRESVLRRVQWLDTGSPTAYHQWKSAEQAFRTARAAHEARYAGDVDLPAYNFTAADIGAARADRDPAMTWLARGLLVAVLLVLVLGAVRPRSTALRALFVATTRPWRLGQLPVPRSGELPAADADPSMTAISRADRIVVWALPAAVLVASRLVYTWFAAPAHLVVTLGAWLILALVLRLVVGRRDPFSLWAALGGVVLLRTVILLVALAVRGPGRYWFSFWTAPTSRTAYITIAFGAFCWSFVVIALVLRRAYGLRRVRAVGATAFAGGLTLAIVSGAVSAIGLERALTIWNDQMALLPWGLSRILGITVYLGIPTWLPAALAVVGLVVAVVGGFAAVLGRAPRQRSTAASGPIVSDTI